MFIGDLRCSKPDTPLHPYELVQPGLSPGGHPQAPIKCRLIGEAVGADCWRKIALAQVCAFLSLVWRTKGAKLLITSTTPGEWNSVSGTISAAYNEPQSAVIAMDRYAPYAET